MVQVQCIYDKDRNRLYDLFNDGLEDGRKTEWTKWVTLSNTTKTQDGLVIKEKDKLRAIGALVTLFPLYVLVTPDEFVPIQRNSGQNEA